MRIVIVGNGKMGQADRRAGAGSAATRSTPCSAPRRTCGGRALTPERLVGADVAVEFTRPDAAPPTSSGSSKPAFPPSPGRPAGSDELPRIAALVEQRGGALLHAANFSLGVHLFLRAAPRPGAPLRRAARSSTPLYWRSITRPSWTRRRAPRASSRRGCTRERWRRVRSRSRRSGPAPRRARTSWRTTGRTSGCRSRTKPGAATASPPARWPPPNGCRAIRGVHTVEDMLFGDAG